MLKPSAIVGSAFLLLSMITLTNACPAQGVTWTQTMPARSPSGRYSQAMAFDAARVGVLLFGGLAPNGGPIQDTWEWDGVVWTQHSPTRSPLARFGHKMAFDAARQFVLLFGGDGMQGRLGDTWGWDGVNWTQLAPAQSPPARVAAAMVEDGTRQRVMLFGGAGPSGPLQDTWEWDGVNWTQLTPARSPSPRSDHAMAYDAMRQRLLMFGGNDYAGSELQDTWEWDGVNWTQLAPAQSPPARVGHAMAYDPVRQRVLLFGGYVNSVGNWLSDTWEWDGQNWNLLFAAQSPPPRVGHSIAYDAARQRAMLFGGSGVSASHLSDTWGYDSLSPASFATFGTGCPGSLGNVTLDAAPHSLPWTGDNFSVDLDNLPANSVPFMALGFDALNPPVNLSGLGLAGCWQLISAETAVSLTLNGNTATWSQTVPVNPALVGWSLFLQGAALNAGGNNVLGAALSNGAQATIGMR